MEFPKGWASVAQVSPLTRPPLPKLLLTAPSPLHLPPQCLSCVPSGPIYTTNKIPRPLRNLPSRKQTCPETDSKLTNAYTKKVIPEGGEPAKGKKRHWGDSTGRVEDSAFSLGGQGRPGWRGSI